MTLRGLLSKGVTDRRKFCRPPARAGVLGLRTWEDQESLGVFP